MAGLHEVTVGADRIAGYFRGGNFCEFHESKTIRENFTLKMLTF